VFVGSIGQGFLVCFFVGVAVGMMQIIVRVLVRSFRILVRRRDANMYTQHKTARIARQVGDSLGGGYFVSCVFFPVGRLPRDGF